jgi:hypothetical protein
VIVLQPDIDNAGIDQRQHRDRTSPAHAAEPSAEASTSQPTARPTLPAAASQHVKLEPGLTTQHAQTRLKGCHGVEPAHDQLEHALARGEIIKLGRLDREHGLIQAPAECRQDGVPGRQLGIDTRERHVGPGVRPRSG